MSRVGKKPIQIPEGVNVEIDAGVLVATGPKGESSHRIPRLLTVSCEDNQVRVERKNDSKVAKSLHGLHARLIRNLLKGVSEGWSKTLELVGTGYRARLEGEALVLAVGFSHPVRVEPPSGVSFSVEENKITVSGLDKYRVYQEAANIRRKRSPEPYKGKGIKYEGEQIRLKPGKAAKAGPAAA